MAAQLNASLSRVFDMTETEPNATEIDPRAEQALSRLLELDPAQARRIREQTPVRVRPRPQSGPAADYA